MTRTVNTILLLIITLTIGIYFGYSQLNKTNEPPLPTPPPSPTSIDLTENRAEAEDQTGTIVGQLCYPSSFLPPGKIEAKNLTTTQIFTKEYAGSDQNPNTNYSINLPSGIYHVRFTSDENGYHTSCATNLETCQEQASHQLTDVVVKPNQTTSGIDLCDFYYSSEAEPEF